MDRCTVGRGQTVLAHYKIHVLKTLKQQQEGNELTKRRKLSKVKLQAVYVCRSHKHKPLSCRASFHAVITDMPFRQIHLSLWYMCMPICTQYNSKTCTTTNFPNNIRMSFFNTLRNYQFNFTFINNARDGALAYLLLKCVFKLR